MEFFVDIVHAVSYSLLLLNTDLHIAELATHMSKSQFVRNTIAAIQMQLRPNSPAQISTSDLIRDDGSSVRGGGSDETEMPHSKRSDSVTSWNSLTREASLLATNSASAPNGASLEENGPTGSSPSIHVTSGQEQIFNRQRGRAWESDMESLLKVRLVFSLFLGVSFNSSKQEMFNAIKNQQILQPINSNMSRSSTSSLSPGGGVLRNRSLRAQPDRLTTLRRSSIRGLQSILSIQQGISPYSSNSSIDGRVSPSPSYATSTHEVRWNFFCPT
jgi:PH/SEC7 domain-containing protein